MITKEAQRLYDAARYRANSQPAKDRSRAQRQADPEKAKAYSRAWRQANKESQKEKKRLKRAANPEFYRAQDRAKAAAYRLRHPERVGDWYRKKANAWRQKLRILSSKYSMGPAEYEALLLKQNYLCAICKTKPEGSHIQIDHCHKTNKIRAMLCHRCNRGLGLFRDNPEFLRLAAKYIEDHS